MPAPQPGRIWLEVCGGIILFFAGVALGHAPFAKTYLPVRAPAALIQEHGKKGPVTKQGATRPRWFADQSDDEP